MSLRRVRERRTTRLSGSGSATTRASAVKGEGLLAEPDGLDVGELADAVGGELAAVAGGLDAAERERRERPDHAVDERLAGLEVADEALLLVRVVGPGVGAEPEPRDVGDADGVVEVLGLVDLGH